MDLFKQGLRFWVEKGLESCFIYFAYKIWNCCKAFVSKIWYI